LELVWIRIGMAKHHGWHHRRSIQYPIADYGHHIHDEQSIRMNPENVSER
jgi:hypothetical protein